MLKKKVYFSFILLFTILWSCATDSNLSKDQGGLEIDGVWEVKLVNYSDNNKLNTINYPLEYFNFYKPEMDSDIDGDGHNESYTESLYFEISNETIRVHSDFKLVDPGVSLEEVVSSTIKSKLVHNPSFETAYTVNGGTIYNMNPSNYLRENVNFLLDGDRLVFTDQWDPTWKVELLRSTKDRIEGSFNVKTTNTMEDYKAYPISDDDYWTFDTPSNQNIDDSKIRELLDEIAKMNGEDYAIHSFTLIRGGKIIFDTYSNGYGPNDHKDMASITKSFAGFLVGKAVEEGYINSIDDTYLYYFPEYATDDELKNKLTIRDILVMRSGIEWYDTTDTYDMFYGSSAVEYILNKPMVTEPGERWEYNSGNSHLLTALVSKVTGLAPYEYANQKLFNPLGIKEYFWWADQEGINTGGFGLHLRPRDLAKFGYLYLNSGKWQDDQIINEEWVSESTRKHSTTYWIGHYGLHWAVTDDEEAFFMDGHGGQQVMVYPDKDCVVVFTSSLNPDEATAILSHLNLKYIKPALK